MRALFALDLDDDATDLRDLFEAGSALLERAGATVDLLSVDVRPSPFVPDLTLSQLAAVLADRSTQRREALDALLDRLRPERRGRARIADARDVADEIVRRAAGADVVVVGTHARRGLPRLWLGSVAEKVVRTCPVPVLVVRPGAAAADPRLLAAVDVRHEPEALIGAAGRWAARLGAVVDALHVVALPDPSLVEYGVAWAAETEETIRRLQGRLEQLLATIPAELRGTARVERGLPGEAVARAAAGHLLVVVGTHGRRGLSHVLLGSVAERILRAAPVSVLAVPLPTE